MSQNVTSQLEGTAWRCIFRPYHDWQLLGRLHQYPTIHNTSSSHHTNQHRLSHIILLSSKIFRYTYRSGCNSRNFILFTRISTTTQTSSSGKFLFLSASLRSCIYFWYSLHHIPLLHWVEENVVKYSLNASLPKIRPATPHTLLDGFFLKIRFQNEKMP